MPMKPMNRPVLRSSAAEEGEAVLRLMGLDARDEGVGFFARERRGEVLHHARSEVMLWNGSRSWSR